MRAFLNDPAIKAEYIAKVKAHADADEIIHGTYWAYGKGCAVGCTVESPNPHELYPTKLGLPEWLAHLEDRIFEGMSNGQSMTWPLRFLEAIPVGADVELVAAAYAAARETTFIAQSEKLLSLLREAS